MDYFPSILGKQEGTNTSEDQLGSYTSISHLKWMLSQIFKGKLSSNTKEHRWLGYVQGVLVVRGVLNVDEERDKTRKIFNGE